jgi:hypothetical protein
VDALISVAAAQARAQCLTEARGSFKWALQVTLSRVDFGQTDLLLGLAQNQMEAGFSEDARATLAQWLDAEPLRTDGSTPYRALWIAPTLTRPAIALLVAGAGAEGHRQTLEAAHAINDTRLRAEVLRKNWSPSGDTSIVIYWQAARRPHRGRLRPPDRGQNGQRRRRLPTSTRASDKTFSTLA